jgi:hypothetical protein
MWWYVYKLQFFLLYLIIKEIDTNFLKHKKYILQKLQLFHETVLIIPDFYLV